MYEAFRSGTALQVTVVRRPDRPGVSHVVSPHGIFRRGPLSYLVGIDHGAGSPMMIRISRIQEARPIRLRARSDLDEELEEFIGANRLEPDPGPARRSGPSPGTGDVGGPRRP